MNNRLHNKDLQNEPKPIFESMAMSDIHLEYGDTIVPEFPVVAPILMLAGDIGRPDIPSLEKFLLAQCQRFEHIFYVAGNHCFYYGEYEERLQQLRELNKLHPRIHFLHKNSYLLPNKVRILGTILWSHIPPETATHVGQTHRDYHVISIATEQKIEDTLTKTSRLITVDDTNKWHAEQHGWLLEEIEKARQNNEHIIIITHHAPSRQDTCLKMDEDLGHQDAYINDHHSECIDPVRLWVYGHTHRSTDLTINSTKIISNQYGYTGEDCGFRPNMKITLYDNGTVTVTDPICSHS